MMAKLGVNNWPPRAKPSMIAAPKLLVVEGQLIIDWPPGDKPKALVITTTGYEAMVAEINRCHKVVAQVMALAMPKQKPAGDQSAVAG